MVPQVQLGPLTQQVFTGVPQSNYASWQEWADEVEEVLSFLTIVGRFADFRPRLQSREWRGVLAEARGGYYLSRVGFSISSAAPQETSCPGDWDIALDDGTRIFVEVKGPTWEGELSDDEILAQRQRQPKYLIGVGDPRGIDVASRIACVIDKSRPKFSLNCPSIIVAVDDLFFPLSFVPTFPDEAASQMRPLREVGGIVWIRPDCPVGHPVTYSVRYVNNDAAAFPIPEGAVKRIKSIVTPITES